DAALVEVLRRLDPVKIQGTLIVAFVAQQWAGARGLQRVLQSERPDELIYVGRMVPGRVLSTALVTTRFPEQPPGVGVLVSTVARGGLAGELTKLAAQRHIPWIQDYSAPLIPRSYLPPPPMPSRVVHLGIATAWSSSPGELIDGKDLSDLAVLLEDYLQGASQKPALPEAHSIPEPALPAKPETKPAPEVILKTLIETYGVSGHEAAVRAAVRQLLPPWAKPTTDSAGNLILHMAMTPSGALKPGILFDAHMDEIGYKVQSIQSGGDLGVAPLGGFLPYFYAGHVAFVHTSTGIWPGVVELPPNWRQPGIKWPRMRIAGAGAEVSPYRVDVGVRTAADASALGIKPGDTITIPKKYRTLAGSCVSGRSLDDRVGDAALISAVWTLGPKPRDREVTFVFSTGEELGLLGAAALAKRLASEGRVPKYVFAIDTFVTSDSPLESPRFADAKVGRGFVVRAVDNSEIMPRTLVERVLRIAQENGIPAQYGVTGGGNDGSAFLRYGSADIALGWPMRYSHSPGEMIDTRDLDGLARIVAAIARQW
ncbi:MAG: M42 family metallopeptidase, partial [Terracidiphilus sp.]